MTKITLKEALEYSIQLWTWLADTGEYFKQDWPGWDEYYRKYYAHEITFGIPADRALEDISFCPLCHYDHGFEHDCRKCPLYCT